jgi:hypothetical protein
VRDRAGASPARSHRRAQRAAAISFVANSSCRKKKEKSPGRFAGAGGVLDGERGLRPIQLLRMSQRQRPSPRERLLAPVELHQAASRSGDYLPLWGGIPLCGGQRLRAARRAGGRAGRAGATARALAARRDVAEGCSRRAGNRLSGRLQLARASVATGRLAQQYHGAGLAFAAWLCVASGQSLEEWRRRCGCAVDVWVLIRRGGQRVTRDRGT